MTVFEMVKYHNQEYPEDIPLHIEEIAAHFDVAKVEGRLDRSLHTEYSYGVRKLAGSLISQYSELTEAQKEGVPQLWKNEQWARQFADFVIELNGVSVAPKVIEVHPPFNDYTDIPSFIKAYAVFEKKITQSYPDVETLIENRCGSIYHGGRFLISKMGDLKSLCEEIDKDELQLRIAFDIPQIYTAHNAKTEEEFIRLLEETRTIREYIGGVHLWGKRKTATGRTVSHCGDLNSYFGDQIVKERFLKAFKECFDDDVVRKLVLEVNSGNEDLLSIVNDLKSVGIGFV